MNYGLENYDSALEEYLMQKVWPMAVEIDDDIALMQRSIEELVRIFQGKFRGEPIAISNSHLEQIFGVSTALGFTFGQACAALERMKDLSSSDPAATAALEEIRSMKRLCGLATTHVAGPNGPSITTTSFSGGTYRISGVAPWVCGVGIFDLLLVSFGTPEGVASALIEMPKSGQENVQLERPSMPFLNGSATASIRFNNFKIENSSVLTRATKNAKEPRISIYFGYELGIAKRALYHTFLTIKNSSHPKRAHIEDALLSLETQVRVISEDLGASHGKWDLLAQIGQINYASVRLLLLAEGGKSMSKECPAVRWLKELSLFDVVAQHPQTISKKIELLKK